MTYNYEEDRMERDARHFDWVPVNDERMTMLRSLRDTCKDCIMCELGRSFKFVNGQRIDPHVFSTMSPSRFMVVGQNPGFNECVQDIPFVGDAGKNFDSEVAKHGLTRKDFYITNIVKCHTDNNASPPAEAVKRCQSFLQMEINIMAPKFIVTLGAVSFGHFCPHAVYQKALGKMTHSDTIDKKVFAIYHPSPRNLSIESRRKAFERQVEMLCKVVKFFSSTQKEQVRNC
jgi:DNA polymerase